MFNKRSFAILAVMAMLIAAAFVLLTGLSTTTTISSVAVSSGNLARQPSGEVPLMAAEASDWYDRHPGSTIPSVDVASDWIERHPEMLVSAIGSADLSDYYLRHPTAGTVDLGDYFLRHPTVHSADLSDYGLRHPETVPAAELVATDFFERHPELLKSGSAADLSDWFQRHPQNEWAVEMPDTTASYGGPTHEP